MAINSTLANQIFFASQGVPATGKENSAGQAYANEVAYAHAATYNPLEVLGGDTKEFVVKIYKTVLGRTNPLQDDPEGVVYWTNAINNGLNKAAFIDEMTAVAIKNGGSDKAAAEAANAAYVNEIYSNILGRPASQDPAGSQYWIDALNKGTIARSKVVDEINAAAAVNKDAGFQTKNTEYVTGLYKDLLGREPEAEGLKYWTDALNAGTSRAELVVSLINSANSGTGADKANLAAKTEALNSFSNNFSDYNVLPGSETYDNARAQAGAEIKGITSSTNNPTTVVTSWLNNSGYKDKYQEDTPAPQGTTLYATYNDELRGEWANASDVANAEVTFKADTAEERALIRQAEEIGVTVNAATQNVSFKNLNGASDLLTNAVINSTPNSAAVVDTKGLVDLPNITTIEDREGNTTLKIDTKIANLTSIKMGNGNDNLNIADADQLSNNKVAVDMGQGGNDTLTLGKGDFSKAFSTISNVDTIVQGDKTTAAHLNLSQIATLRNVDNTAPLNPITANADASIKANRMNFDGDVKLTVDKTVGYKYNDAGIIKDSTATINKIVDISAIRGVSANNQELTLDTVSSKNSDITKVIGNNVDARLHEVLDLGNQSFANLDQIKDIYAVSANKATLQKASALSDGFNLRGELNVTPAASGDLVNTSAGKQGIDLSKIASEALVGGTSIVNVDVSAADVSGAVTEIIGSKDANLVDNVVLKGGTYTKLEKISDASVVSTENNGSFETATLKNAKVLENGFNLKGNVKYAAVEADTAIDLSKVTGEFTDAAGTVKSVAKIDLDTNASILTNLTKVVGSKDAELKEELVLGSKDFTSGTVNKLELIQDINTVTSTGTGATIHNKAIVNGFALTKDSDALNVKVAADDTVVDLSTITVENNKAVDLNISQLTPSDFKSALTSIKGSAAASINDSYIAKATDTYASLTSISDINNLDLSALAKGSHDKLTSIEGGIANLGSGDFTALTTLTAAVRAASGDKVNTLSYDNLAGSGAFNLTLDGSDNKTAGANFVTLAATSKADATDLSAVKVAGNQGVTLAITGVNKNITLSDSKAYANIHEVINLDAAAIGNVTITGFGAGDSIKLPAGSNLQFNIGKFTEIQNNGTIGSGNVYVEMSKVPANVTYDLKNKESVINILEKQFENTGVNTKDSSATIAFNGTDGKSYIWQYLKTSAKEGIQNEDMTLISITDAKFDKNSEITDNGLFASDVQDPTLTPSGNLSGDVYVAKSNASGPDVVNFDTKKYIASGDSTGVDIFSGDKNLYITDEANQLTLSGSAVNAKDHSLSVFFTSGSNGKLASGAGTYTPDSTFTVNAYLGGKAIKDANDVITIASGNEAVGAVTAANYTLANNVYVNTTKTVSFGSGDVTGNGSLAGKVSLQDIANVKDFTADVAITGALTSNTNINNVFKNIKADDKISFEVKAGGKEVAIALTNAAETIKLTKDVDNSKLVLSGLSANDTITIDNDAAAASTKIAYGILNNGSFTLNNGASAAGSGASVDLGTNKTLDLSGIKAGTASGGNININGVKTGDTVTLTEKGATNNFVETVTLNSLVTDVNLNKVAKGDKLGGSIINTQASSIDSIGATGIAKDTAVTYTTNEAVDTSTKLAAVLKTDGIKFDTSINKGEDALLLVTSTSDRKLYIYEATSNATGSANADIDAGELALIAVVDGVVKATSIDTGVITF